MPPAARGPSAGTWTSPRSASERTTSRTWGEHGARGLAGVVGRREARRRAQAQVERGVAAGCEDQREPAARGIRRARGDAAQRRSEVAGSSGRFAAHARRPA